MHRFFSLFLRSAFVVHVAAFSLGPTRTALFCSSRFSAHNRSPLNLRAKLDAVLFDCDGVLADTERDGHRISFNKAFKEFGLKVDGKDMEWDVDLYGKLLEIGGGKERMMGYWNEIGWTEGNMELAKKLHERKTKIFSDLIISGEIPLRPGVIRLVDEIFAGQHCYTDSNESILSYLLFNGETNQFNDSLSHLLLVSISNKYVDDLKLLR
jgi:hypothetical protein